MSKELSNKKQLVNLLESETIKNKLKDILGKNASTFATSLVQIQSQNKMLEKATPESLIGAAMTAATLNLPLNNQLGHAYIVPFNERQSDGSYLTKAQFMLGYKGLKQLCTRSGLFIKNNVSDVREGEIQGFDNLTGEIEFSWEQDYGKRQKMKIVGYIHYYELKNGFSSIKFMSIDELTAHGKKYSQTFKKGFGQWKDDFDSMCKKTIAKLHLNDGNAPITIDIQNAIIKDQASVEMDEQGEEKTTYVDNEPPKKIDHDKERMLTLINDAKTLDDIEFAEGVITDPTLIPVLKAKKIQITKTKKNEVS